ncbi:DUF397 domain-containing protein [Allosalinactinospora lopnorensis]|uniref:DUF397 domain-containing protein n=1 Tax=Allosalinactinospora lopnorensis TaxID=1352348 RepID=UPI000623E274|nr:DUF397 domain-containing protein [Allosalinactinospora lopnorensis]
MTKKDPYRPRWRASSYSGTSGGQCVEVARLPGTVAMRDSKTPGGAVLSFSPDSWTAFIEAATRADL